MQKGKIFPGQVVERKGKIIIHNLSSADFAVIDAEGFPRALSPEDCSVLFLARKLKAALLSNDKLVRNQAKRLDVEYRELMQEVEKRIKQWSNG